MKRRLTNMDRRHSIEERTNELTKYIKKLKDSEYDTSTREEILRSGIRNYYRKVIAGETGGPGLYRDRRQMDKDRKYKGMTVKNWYKPKRGGQKIAADKDSPWEIGQKWRIQGRTNRERMREERREREEERRMETERIKNGRKVGKETEERGSEKGGILWENKKEGEEGEGGKKTKIEGEEREKIKVIETVIFIPHTRRSVLRNTLQRKDDELTETYNSPGVRFVERGGKQSQMY